MIHKKGINARKLILLLSLCSATAQGLEHEDLFSLTLEQLMEIKVNVVSKREENALEAPSVVSVITRSDISKYGANDLHDVLRRIPGLQPFGSIATVRDNQVSIRGQYSSSIDARTLLLMNGRPMRDTNTGGLNSPFYRAIPISSIERIEVIRGPGSVLYGSNAFSGVINIVTRSDQEKMLQVSMGSMNTKQVEGYFVEKKGDLLFRTSAKYLESDGWSAQFIDAGGNKDEASFYKRDYSVNFDITYKSFRFQFLQAKATDNVINVGAFWPDLDYPKRRSFADISWQEDINVNWSVNGSITYNGQRRKNETGNVFLEDDNLFTEIAVNGSIANGGILVTGITWNKMDSEDKAAPDTIKFDTNWKSVYVQYSQPIVNQLVGTIGTHYSDVGTDTNIIWRAGLVYEFSSRLSSKLLWGQAYRAPFGAELSFNSPFLKGNPNLLPEQSDNLDIQLIYKGTKYLAELAYFYTEVTNGTRVANGTFDNEIKMDFKGFEGGLHWYPAYWMDVEITYSKQENELDSGVKDVQLLPNDILRLGFFISQGNGWSIGFFNTHYSSYTDKSKFSPSVTEVNPDSGGYDHTTLDISMDAQKVIHPQLNGLNISLFVENMLESDPVYLPDIWPGGVNTLPMRPERSIHLKFIYTL